MIRNRIFLSRVRFASRKGELRFAVGNRLKVRVYLQFRLDMMAGVRAQTPLRTSLVSRRSLARDHRRT